MSSNNEIVNSTSDSNKEADGVDGCQPKDVADPPPKRPTSAYNLFFRMERRRIVDGNFDTTRTILDRPRSSFTADEVATFALQERIESNAKLVLSLQKLLPKRKHVKTHGKIGFGELARQIAILWKTVSPQEMEHFEKGFQIEKDHYQSEYKKWLLRNPNQAKSDSVIKKKGKDGKKTTVRSVTDTSSTCSTSTISSRSIVIKSKAIRTAKVSRTRTLDTQIPSGILQIPDDEARDRAVAKPGTSIVETLQLHDRSTLPNRLECIDNVSNDSHQDKDTATKGNNLKKSIPQVTEMDRSKINNEFFDQVDNENKSTISQSPEPSEEYGSYWEPVASFQSYTPNMNCFSPIRPPMRRTVSVMSSSQPQTGMTPKGHTEHQDDKANNENVKIIDPRNNDSLPSTDQDIDEMMKLLSDRKKKLEEVRAIVAMEKDLLFQERELEKHYYMLKGLEVHRSHPTKKDKNVLCFDPTSIAESLASLQDSIVAFSQSKSSSYYGTLSNTSSHETGMYERQFEPHDYRHGSTDRDPKIVQYPVHGVDTTTTNMNHDFTTKAVTASTSMLNKSYAFPYNHHAKGPYKGHPNHGFHTPIEDTHPSLYHTDEHPDQYRRYGIQAVQEPELERHVSSHSHLSNTSTGKIQFVPAQDNDSLLMNSHGHSYTEYVQDEEMYDEKGSYKNTFGSLPPPLNPVHQEDGTESLYSFVDEEVTTMLLSDDF